MSAVLYGISNCDTVRKARRWLDSHAIDYRFHDFRKDGLDAARVGEWIDRCGWETVINRRGTTWRALDEAARDSMDAKAAIAAAVENPALIKRPVLCRGDELEIGFKADRYVDLFQV